MGILDFLEVLAFKKLSVPQQPTGRAGTELQCSLEMENTLGMVAGLHVQQHIQDAKHRVTVLPSTNAPPTQNTSSPWDSQVHFRTPENEGVPKCSPWDSAERLDPAPSTDHRICGSPVRLWFVKFFWETGAQHGVVDQGHTTHYRESQDQTHTQGLWTWRSMEAEYF